MIRRPPRSTLFPTRRSSDLHAQGDGTRPTPEEQQKIVDFETKLFTAQIRDRLAGNLYDDGAKGGPTALSTQDRKSTRLNSSHSQISYAVFCLKKKKIITFSTSRRGTLSDPSLPSLSQLPQTTTAHSSPNANDCLVRSLRTISPSFAAPS